MRFAVLLAATPDASRPRPWGQGRACAGAQPRWEVREATPMPLYGNLASMPLADLLQFIGNSRRSGCLQIEHTMPLTRLFFHQGSILSCASDDPPKLLGQFLMFEGVLNEETLRAAMARQEATGESLNRILVDMEAATQEHL